MPSKEEAVIDVQRENARTDITVLARLWEAPLDIEVAGDRIGFVWGSHLVFAELPRGTFREIAEAVHLGEIQVARALDRLKASGQIVVEFDYARDGAWVRNGDSRRQVRFCHVRPLTAADRARAMEAR
jgi:hypothetical protein